MVVAIFGEFAVRSMQLKGHGYVTGAINLNSILFDALAAMSSICIVKSQIRSRYRRWYMPISPLPIEVS